MPLKRANSIASTPTDYQIGKLTWMTPNRQCLAVPEATKLGNCGTYLSRVLECTPNTNQRDLQDVACLLEGEAS